MNKDSTPRLHRILLSDIRTAYYLGNLQAGSRIPDMYPVWLDTRYGIRLFSLSTIQPVPVASFVWQKLHLHKRPSYLASRISGVYVGTGT